MEAKAEAEAKANAVRQGIKLPEKTDTQTKLEAGTLSLKDYIKGVNSSLPKTTIIQPTPLFYRRNDIDMDLLYKEENMTKYTTDTFIIIKRYDKREDDYWKIWEYKWMYGQILCGLLINYIDKTIYVIKYDAYFSSPFRILDYGYMLTSRRSLKESLDKLPKYVIERQQFRDFIQMLGECLDESIKYLTEHIKNTDMVEDILKKKEELQREEFNADWFEK